MSLERPLPSPCIQVCKLDAAQQYCLGCARTLAEIGAWSRMDRNAQAQVWRALPERAARWQLPIPTLPKELQA